MKRIIFTLMIVCITYTISVYGQEQFKTVNIEQITDPFWKKVSKVYWGKTKLPHIESKSITLEYYSANQAYKLYPYDKKQINPQLPLYALPDTNIKDSEQRIFAAFYNTNGNYFIALINALAGDHRSQKLFIVTFDFNGNICDYRVFFETFTSGPHDTNIVESRLNADLSIETNILELNDPYPVNEDFTIKSGLHGQRIDRKYQITPQGKFKLISETKYQPKNYTAEELAGTTCIADGGEQPIK